MAAVNGKRLMANVVNALERMSLIKISNQGTVDRLMDTIKLADQIKDVNTDGVEAMFTPLEKESLYLRDDGTELTDRKAILQNASQVIEDYFVVPAARQKKEIN